MLIGEFHHTVDSKGRLIVPARFREELGDRFIVTRGLDNCLFVYPMAEWRQLETKLKSLPMTQPNARAFVRFMFSGATECVLDRQGRILLPNNLRDYARLERDVVVLGLSSRVEVWSLAEWSPYAQRAEVAYSEIAEKLVDLGI
ncbi:MAG: division/cell wall cluster transcriptional repressor MraZ [Thermaerobacterales bacterium]